MGSFARGEDLREWRFVRACRVARYSDYRRNRDHPDSVCWGYQRLRHLVFVDPVQYG